MEYNERRKQEIKRQFASIRRKQIIVSVPLVVLMIFFTASSESAAGAGGNCSVSLLTPILFIAVIGVLVFSLINWRCPACNKYLGRSMNPRYCSKCGAELR